MTQTVLITGAGIGIGLVQGVGQDTTQVFRTLARTAQG